MEKILIGRKDKADFLHLEMEKIDVKIDSGAYTSSFHCHQVKRFSKEGKEYVVCRFLDPQHTHYHEKEFIFEVFKLRRIKSSNGHVEERISIQTEIILFKRVYPVELTLTERADMKYPVLLGRRFISKKFLIDTSRKNLSFKGQTVRVKGIS